MRFWTFALACVTASSIGASCAFAVSGGAPPGRSDRLARATVAVGALVDRSGSVGLSYCSGVLLSPDEVLTAGHCVQSNPIEAVVLAGFGRLDRMKRYRVSTVARYAFAADQSFSPYVTSLAQLTFDTALLRLSSHVPGARRLQVASRDSGLPRVLRLDGRGLSGRSVGVLRSALLVPIARSSSGLMVAQTTGALVCRGDSGSPVAAIGRSGVPIVFGVASAVLTSNGTCGNIVVVAPARPQ